MPRTISVLPASTQAGRETIRALLDSEENHTIRGFYRDPSKAPAEYTANPNFEAVKGDISTGEGLALEESDAVLYIAPPTYDGSDEVEYATRTATNVKRAIESAPSIKKLVLHSSMGAQHESGIGVLRLNHITDKILSGVSADVLVVKPTWFYQNWAPAAATLNEANPKVASVFSPADLKLPMVSVVDVGRYCAQVLLDTTTQHGGASVQIFGPRLYTPADVVKALEEASGKTVQLEMIPKDKLEDYFRTYVPEKYVPSFAEMIHAMLPGGIIGPDADETRSDVVRGETELVDYFKELLQQGSA